VYNYITPYPIQSTLYANPSPLMIHTFILCSGKVERDESDENTCTTKKKKTFDATEGKMIKGKVSYKSLKLLHITPIM
jgi:hypothetical protein